MSSDIRELLRSAAEADPAGLGARAAMERGVRLRRRRRVEVAATVVVAAAVLVAVVLPRVGSFVDAERISPARPGRTHEAPSDAHDARPDPRRTADPSGAGDAPTTGTQPRTADTAQAPTQRSSGCSPLIEDPRFDVSDSSIDILRSSMSYRADTNTLTFAHTFLDIKSEPNYSTPAEGPFYDLRFAWDGVEYSAEAYTTASGEDEIPSCAPRTGHRWGHRAP